MIRRRPAPRRGMSLIEVILSMAIFLLALVGIGKLIDFGSDQALDTQFQTRGTRLALAKLAEVEAGVITLESGGGTGTFDEEPAWSWSVEAVPTGPPNVYQVTVKVSRDRLGVTFEVALSQMLFDPSKTGSAAQAQKPTDTSTTGTTTGTTGTTTGGMGP